MTRQQARALAVTALLAAVSIAWATVPAGGARPGLRAAVIVAVVCAVLGLGRLAIGELRIGGSAFDSVPVRLAGRAAELTRSLPWPEMMIIAVVTAEALHRARPWHTAVLGVALLAFVFAAHLAESASPPGVLRPQLPVLAAGLGLLALAVGAAALPAPQAGLIRVIAVIAAVLAAGLALPVRRS
jgi:hypothetical protein